MFIDTLKISGPLVERFQASYPPHGPRRKMTEEEKTKRREIKARYNAGLEVPDQEKLAPSFRRARSRIRRLLFANAHGYRDKKGIVIPPKFLTLTFQENIRDLKRANRYFSEFIQWLNYEFRDVLNGSIQYVCVPEFQGRGAIHYHVLFFNFPFVDKVFMRIRKRWKDRFELVTIRKNQGMMRMVSYLSKYISKQGADGRFFGQKRFFASRGLNRTIVLRDEAAVGLICGTLETFGVRKTEHQLDLPFIGKAHYVMYYLGDGSSLNIRLLDEYSRNALELAQQQK